MLDAVALQQMKARLRAECFGQMGVEIAVFLNRPNLGARCEQGRCQRAEARANFDDRVAGTDAAELE